MAAYYNEHDKNAAAWIRELIARGLIAPGEVDERDIRDVLPSDLRGFVQCHFFAGIGVWSYALRCAGVPDDEPVWTASCPCQPFSAAGKGGGFDDERHLWPDFFWLMRQAKPRAVPVFGEQVASKDGLAWLDLVQADLEGSGYALGAVDICAAGIGAPHIRQRLYWVADDASEQKHAANEGRFHAQPRRDRGIGGVADSREMGRTRPDGRGSGLIDANGLLVSGMADSEPANGRAQHEIDADPCGRDRSRRSGNSDGMEHASRERREEHPLHLRERESRCPVLDASGPGPTRGFWRECDWALCRDEVEGVLSPKWRAISLEPVRLALVDGASGRLGNSRDGCPQVPRREEDGGEEVKRATDDKTYTKQALCQLRDEDGAEALQRGARRHVRLHEAEVLRTTMHGGGVSGPNQGPEPQEQQTSIREGSQSGLRDMQQDGAASRPSSRSGSDEQRSRQFADFVRLVPWSIAFAQLHGDSTTAEALLALLEACDAARIVQHPPNSVEEAWRPLTEKSLRQLRVGFDEGRFLTVSSFPLADGAAFSLGGRRNGRAALLAGAGNAIVAPLAQAFIESYYEARGG